MSPPTRRKPADKGEAPNTYDDIDRRILEILQVDSDRPVSSIAEEVGLSQTPCWRRIKRFEEAGVIRCRVALVDPRKVGVPLTVFIGVKTPRHEAKWLAAFRALIDDIPEVVEAYRLTGEIDYILKVVVPDIAAYDAVYKSMIGRLDFSQVNSSISMEELKFTTAMPLHHL
jgi:Lrp/AsnC family transcriptional regulator